MLKPKISISNLFDLTGAEIYNPDDFKSTQWVSIDSRKIRKGAIFVAVRGNKFDGHKFVEDAIKNGAGAIIISERKLKDFDRVSIPIITVPNPIIAYGELANCWRHKLNAKVISITGSNGKTTTKDILATILSSKYKVVKTEANNNNHIGVPLTILSSKPGTEFFVLEHGTNHFGEIEYTAKIAQPDYALITNIGESHLEFLNDKMGVLNEKSFLYDECINRKGICFINNDDPLLRNKYKKYSKRITYGFKGKPNYKGSIISYDDLGRTKISITSQKYNFESTLPLLGESNAQNFLASFSLAQQLGINKKDLQKSVAEIQETPGRMKLVERSNILLVDDSYNANPNSVAASIKVLRRIKRYSKSLVILGDMFELGKEAAKIHKNLSDLFTKWKNLRVYTLGELMSGLNKQLEKNKINCEHFTTRKALLQKLDRENLENNKILVKGSRGMKMEEFVEIIKSKAG